MTSLFADLYFWVGLVFFVLSVAGIFWILKSIHRESEMEEAVDAMEMENVYQAPPMEPPVFLKTARTETVPEPPVRQEKPGASIESIAQQIAQLEESLSKIEKKMNEQNHDQLNEIAGQMKMIVQMLKTVMTGDTTAQVSGKVDKIYQILSSLSQTEEK